MAASGIDVERVARAVTGALRALAAATGDGWARAGETHDAIATGLPIPTMNGVWALAPDAGERALSDALHEIAGRVPAYGLQCRPASIGPASAAAATHGLVPAPGPLPLMATTGPVSARDVPGLTIERLGGERAHLHAELAARAFAAPARLFELVTAPALRIDGTRLYLGTLAGGEPVTTALSFSLHGWVGVYNVATPPEHRGHGYASAITARAVADGLAAGARWAWLQSSPDGLPVYRRLGFDVLEEWSVWLTP